MSGHSLLLLRDHQKFFKALSGTARLEIIDILYRRRATLTQVSRGMGRSMSTTLRHISMLADADVVVRLNNGHRWKYYELSGNFRRFLDGLGEVTCGPKPAGKADSTPAKAPALWEDRLQAFLRRRSASGNEEAAP